MHNALQRRLPPLLAVLLVPFNLYIAGAANGLQRPSGPTCRDCPPIPMTGPIDWWHVLKHPPTDSAFWSAVWLDRIIISLPPEGSLTAIQSFLNRWHLAELLDSSMFPHLQRFYSFRVPIPTPEYIYALVQDAFFNERPRILGVEPEPKVRILTCVPNDPAWDSIIWSWAPWLIWADSAWCYSTGGSPYWIGIIDNALDYNHEDLTWAFYGYDFADNDNDVYPPSASDDHGTHVTGIAAATINNMQGIAGIVNDTIVFGKAMPDAYSGTPSLSTTAIINAINAMANTAPIRAINMSFGSSTYNAAMHSACQTAWNNGKILIAASGNSATSPVAYPARYPEVIAVGSVDYNSNNNTISLSNFSNYGTDQEVVAPGGSLVYGGFIYQVIAPVPYDSLYNYKNGTSMAAPHVTGLAQLLFSVHPCMDNRTARRILQITAMDLGAPGKDQFYGYGLVMAHLAVIEALPVRIDTVIIQAPSCANSCDGAITVVIDTPWDGIGPLSIAWSDGVNGTLVRTGLCAGTYIVTLTDTLNCGVADTIQLIAPPPLTVNGTTQNPTCAGTPNGSITLNISGGTGAYSCSWNTGQSGCSLTNLDTGIYIVTVTDANGCTVQDTFSLLAPNPPQLTVQAQDPTCPQTQDGSITVVPTGGTPPYSCTWNTGQTGCTLSGLTAGTYIVTVQDSAGCATTDTIVLTGPPAPLLTVQTQDPTCSYTSDGSLTVAINGNQPPYSCSWNTGDTGCVLNNLPEGTYIVTVTDGAGCQFTDTLTLTALSHLSLMLVQEVHPLCPGDSSGVIAVTGVQGIPPYTYQWNTGDTGAVLQGMGAGVYSVVVTDQAGCQASGTFALVNQDSIQVNVDTVIAATGNTCTGAIHLTIQGGTPPYSIVWSSGDTGSIVTGLCPGWYTATVTDVNGCRVQISVQVPGDAPTGTSLDALSHSGNPLWFTIRQGSWLLVQNRGTTPVQLALYTADGRQVAQVLLPAQGQYQFALAPGVYFIWGRTAQWTTWYKVLINR